MAAQQAVYIPYEPPSEERLLAEELTQAAQWMPDDASKRCLVCNGGFDKVFKSKHHCRACGILVCNGCSSQRALIPLGQCVLPPISDITRSENELDARTPQRVCLNCWRDLAPLQEDLQQTVSRSVVPVESDRSNFGRFLNLPFQVTLQDEIRKGANTLHNYMVRNGTTPTSPNTIIIIKQHHLTPLLCFFLLLFPLSLCLSVCPAGGTHSRTTRSRAATRCRRSCCGAARGSPSSRS